MILKLSSKPGLQNKKLKIEKGLLALFLIYLAVLDVKPTMGAL
jgi:hypothetical protein